MRRGVIFWGLLLAAILGLGVHGVCFADEKYKIACFVRSMDDEYLAELAQELRTQLQDSCEIEVYDAQNDMHLQLSQLRASIHEKTDLVLVNIVRPVYVSEVLEMLQKFDLPAVFFKNEPNVQIFEGYKNVVMVANNGVEEGRRQGRLLDLVWNLEKYDKNKDGKLQYVLLQGPAGNFEAISRSLYSINTAKELGLPLEQLGENFICNWRRSLCYEAMPQIMEKYGDSVELIISNNDNMALGALRYLNEQGLNVEQDDIAIIGFDGIKEAREKIRQGVFTATVVQGLDEMAYLIKEMVINHLSGKDWLYGTGYQWEVDNVSVRINGNYTYLAKEGAYVRKIIDF